MICVLLRKAGRDGVEVFNEVRPPVVVCMLLELLLIIGERFISLLFITVILLEERFPLRTRFGADLAGAACCVVVFMVVARALGLVLPEVR